MTSADDFAAILAMPTCRLGVAVARQQVLTLVFLAPDTPTIPASGTLCEAISTALDAYLQDGTPFPALPLAQRGTPFQRRVWSAISAIPAGQTRQYGEMAHTLGSAARAVGQACGANPFPLVVPCHRVLGSKGIGGFANHTEGWLIETKRWLLWHEGVLA